MDRPSTSQQSVEKLEVYRPSTSHESVGKVEMFEVREHVPYQAEVTRAPGAYDAESGDVYTNSWDSAWLAICQFVNLLHHMQIAIVVFCLWHFALTVEPNGTITNLQLHIIFAGTGVRIMIIILCSRNLCLVLPLLCFTIRTHLIFILRRMNFNENKTNFKPYVGE